MLFVGCLLSRGSHSTCMDQVSFWCEPSLLFGYLIDWWPCRRLLMHMSTGNTAIWQQQNMDGIASLLESTLISSRSIITSQHPSGGRDTETPLYLDLRQRPHISSLPGQRLRSQPSYPSGPVHQSPLHSVPSPLRLVYTEIVLKALKLSLAVVNTMPGICGWKCSSFTSFCPWCTNSN